MCEEHLQILENRIPVHLRNRLTLYPGSYPDDVDIMPNSLRAILACRVLHFFSPEVMRKAIGKMADMLQNGGRVFIVGATWYQKRFQSVVPVYETCIQHGDPWPGWFEDASKYCCASDISNIPKDLNLLDPCVLRREFELQGFQIQWTEFMRGNHLPSMFG